MNPNKSKLKQTRTPTNPNESKQIQKNPNKSKQIKPNPNKF